MIGKLALMMIIACLLSLGFAQGDGIAGNDSQYNLTKGTLIDTNESFVVIHMDDPSNNSNQSDGSYLVRKINLTSNELTLDNCSPYIQGISFNDINGNGIKDRNENGLAGWIVKLTKPDGTVASTSTAQSGSYFFASIQPGDYIVSENCHDQWIQTAPSISYYSVTVSNEDITPLNFGNAFVGSKNNPPAAPAKPTGPVSCITGESHSYSTLATDPDSDQIQYTFDWGDGSPTADTSFVNSGTSASLSHKWSTAGTYNVKVKAMDAGGLESPEWSQALTVTITLSNAAPGTPAITAGPTTGYGAVSYQYTVSATDPGDQIKYTFNWGDQTSTTTGFFASGAPTSASHIWSAAGPYTVTVKATDTSNVDSAGLGTITVVISPNNPPTAPAIPAGISSGIAGTQYNFNTFASDPDYNTIKYTFDWDDGSTSESAMASSSQKVYMAHAWSAKGTFNIRAKATDSNGAQSAWSSARQVTMN